VPEADCPFEEHEQTTSDAHVPAMSPWPSQLFARPEIDSDMVLASSVARLEQCSRPPAFVAVTHELTRLLAATMSLAVSKWATGCSAAERHLPRDGHRDHREGDAADHAAEGERDVRYRVSVPSAVMTKWK
jgi:hypothetical protein